MTRLPFLDEAGCTVWRGKRPSDPEALATALRRYAPEPVRARAGARQSRCALDWRPAS